MIKVFLAEDEFVIREAVKRTIDWNKEGYELVGEAGDGETALEKLRECRADILITDIRMPFMDGLELAKAVRKELPETLIVILSGYDDFGYAKEAIRLGVTEYLLKPVTGSALLESLAKVSEKLESIRARQKHKALYEKVYQPQHEQQLENARQEIYRSMVSGKLDFAAAMKRSQELGIRISADYYALMMIRLSRMSEEQQKMLLQHFLVQLRSRNYVGGYVEEDSVLCLVIMANEQAQLQERVSETAAAAQQYLNENQDLYLAISAGDCVEGLDELPASYRQTREGLGVS